MRSDIEIQADVLDEIRWDPRITATNVGVEVSEGVVTLSGHVESYSEKLHAEKAVKRVYGVHAISQEIRVLLPGSSVRSDTEIARQIQSIILWSNIDPDEHIYIKVERGFITLSGKVDAYHQKELAQNFATNMLGVIGVTNLIKIEPKLSIPIIKKDIKDSFKRKAVDQAEKLDITIDKNIVTIAGKVKSWSERNSAINAVWSIPTVENVIDRIQVTP